MRTFDLALVGTGGIAAVHAEAVARLAGRARIVAAVDVDWDRLLGFGQRFAVPRLYRDIDAMLAAETPDLVHLCTPPGLHAEQAMGCLRHGVPVLCEKPPALSLAEFDEIAAVSTASGAPFATVFQHRFGSGGLALRRLPTGRRSGRP